MTENALTNCNQIQICLIRSFRYKKHICELRGRSCRTCGNVIEL